MGYPSGIQVFTTKLDGPGNVVQAAHINDPQTEIVAIETALLGTITHSVNVSGASTLATLQATNSTFAHIEAGNSTITGNLTVTGTLTNASLTSPPVVKVSHSAAQEAAIATWTGLNWDTEVYDSTGMHSTSVNSSRLTFAASSGTYHVGATVEWSTTPNNTDQKRVRIMVNDSSVVGQVMSNISGLSTVTVPITLGADLHVGSTADYVTLQVFSIGSTNRIFAESTGVALGFWAHRVSAA